MLRNLRFTQLRRWYSQNTSSDIVKLGIIGVPSEFGQDKRGPGRGPSELRKAGLLERLISENNVDIKDYGDVIVPEYSDNINFHLDEFKNCKKFAACVNAAEKTSNKVKDILSEGRICCALGGDHSIALGTVHGHMLATDANVALLWIDAHADINTHSSSDSGNMHGMPVSLLTAETRKYWPEIPALSWLRKSLPANNIAYIGLRSVDVHERVIIDELGITAFGMRDIEKHGIDRVINFALDKIDPKGDKSLHVSFDIDSLEPFEAPSTGTPVRGGLSLREGIHIMETVNERGNLRAMDMVEVNPLIGNELDARRTLDAAIEIISAAFIRGPTRSVNVLDIPMI